MSLPKTATPAFRELLEVYRGTEIEFPHLKPVSFAQWALECGWGTSRLAREHRNYAGMKWRKVLAKYGKPVAYEAHDGSDTYMHFEDDANYIAAYWKRFDVISAYAGWRENTYSPLAFINKIGGPWVGGSPQHQQQYIQKVLNLRQRVAPLFED